MSVTLHTDVGDIKIEVFCERTPKTCENFLALCASNYYNGCIFHRNIKGFMVQTGDPTGTGRGGNSIWGKKFEDEYSEYLKHNVRGVVSMANNGPNTNGSQFFITYGKQPHLDMKYTVFGNFRRTQHLCLYVVLRIEPGPHACQASVLPLEPHPQPPR
uniref:peptidyl-prolyl cis-trans isomerase-like 3 isoform X2 n=1 Tax=Callospermophilus lateralis TaxID=76772 RepID=UPI004038E942